MSQPPHRRRTQAGSSAPVRKAAHVPAAHRRRRRRPRSHAPTGAGDRRRSGGRRRGRCDRVDSRTLDHRTQHRGHRHCRLEFGSEQRGSRRCRPDHRAAIPGFGLERLGLVERIGWSTRSGAAATTAGRRRRFACRIGRFLRRAARRDVRSTPRPLERQTLFLAPIRVGVNGVAQPLRQPRRDVLVRPGEPLISQIHLAQTPVHGIGAVVESLDGSTVLLGEIHR